MQYTLTEDQSTEFYNNMCLIDAYVEETNEKAVQNVRKWYDTYLGNRKWYWPKRSFKSFLCAIATFDGLELRTSSIGIEYLGGSKGSGWVGHMKNNKIHELTGLPEDVIAKESLEVWDGFILMHRYSSFVYRNFDTLQDIRQYSKVPYTLDNRLLSHLKSCEQFIEEMKLEE